MKWKRYNSSSFVTQPRPGCRKFASKWPHLLCLMPGLKCLKPSLENFCGTCWNSVRTKHIQSIQEFKYFKYSKYSNIQSNQNRPQRIFWETCWNSAQSKKPSSFLSNFLKAASTRLSLWRAYKLYIRTIIKHPHHHHQHHHHHHRQNLHHWIDLFRF